MAAAEPKKSTPPRARVCYRLLLPLCRQVGKVAAAIALFAHQMGSSPLAQGNGTTCQCKRNVAGSSPHAQGNGRWERTLFLSRRFIPARAGKRLFTRGHVAQNMVHPRTRGETSRLPQEQRTATGSSPLRGEYAGSTATRVQKYGSSPLRGKYDDVNPLSVYWAGSSPRVGKYSARKKRRRRNPGSSPAYAGKRLLKAQGSRASPVGERNRGAELGKNKLIVARAAADPGRRSWLAHRAKNRFHNYLYRTVLFFKNRRIGGQR